MRPSIIVCPLFQWQCGACGSALLGPLPSAPVPTGPPVFYCNPFLHLLYLFITFCILSTCFNCFFRQLLLMHFWVNFSPDWFLLALSHSLSLHDIIRTHHMEEWNCLSCMSLIGQHLNGRRGLMWGRDQEACWSSACWSNAGSRRSAP